MPSSRLGRYLIRVGQVVFLTAGLLGFWRLNGSKNQIGAAFGRPTETPNVEPTPEISLPEFTQNTPVDGVSRQALLYTVIPNRPSMKIRTYKVKSGRQRLVHCEKVRFTARDNPLGQRMVKF
jgi:hypothetical protein